MIEQEILRILQERFDRVRLQRPEYSLRSYAKFLKLNPTQLSQTLRGQRRLTPKIANRVMIRLGLEPIKINSALARMATSKKHWEKENEEAQFAVISPDAFSILADWFGPAILAFSECETFKGEANEVAKALRIKIRDARRILEALLKLGLLEKTDCGRVLATGKKFSTTREIPSSAIQLHHQRTLTHAAELLSSVPVPQREYRAHYICSEPERVARAKEMINDFMLRLTKFLEAGKKRELYRISLQFAPLTGGVAAKKNNVIQRKDT